MTIDEFAIAVQTQIAAASGLGGSKVIWETPNVTRPARPFLALTILEDGGEEPLPEETCDENPSPEQDVPAFMFLPEVFPQLFQDGTLTVGSVASGGLGNYVTFATVMDGGDGFGFPRVTIDMVAEDPETPAHAQLTLHCDAGYTGNGIAAVLNTFLSSPEGDGLFVMDSVIGLNDPQTDPLGPIAFAGGEFGQDPILLKTTDRPEITVRVVAFTDSPKVGFISPAFSLLKQVRRKMGSESTADALDPITVLDRGNVTNATVVLETGYEGRAVLDLKFGSIETETEGINSIETVKTHITVKNLDGSEIINKTITLPQS